MTKHTELLSKDPISKAHWLDENFVQRCTRKEAQQILVQHEVLIYNGRLYKTVAKSIGAGIYEITKKVFTRK